VQQATSSTGEHVDVALDDHAPSVDSIVTEVLEVLLERHLDATGPIGVDELGARIPVPATLISAAVDRLLADGHATATLGGVELADGGARGDGVDEADDHLVLFGAGRDLVGDVQVGAE
jgi:hypothetical protein